MRSNSGNGKSSNIRGNPTLEEHEQARGRSGEAITGDKKVGGEPNRTESRSDRGSP
jgi:hypothetical protein